MSFPPRVLQVVLSLNPGGTERLVLDLVSRLHEEMPMAVCCLDSPGAWAQQVSRLGVDLTSLGRTPGFHPRLGLSIRARMRAHRATVVHAHHYSPFVYSAIARVLSPHVRLVFTEHGRLSDSPPSPRRRIANQVLGRVPDRVVAVSEDLRRYMLAEGFAPAQVEVVPNGIDPGPEVDQARRAAVRKRLGVDERVFVIGTIARLDPVKNLGALLDATHRLGRSRSIRTVVIGDGPERQMLEQHATTLGIADCVTWLGQSDDARGWLAGCDAYVNSSISEGVSLTILEAMAASLPVVATAVGGTPEIIGTDCGILVPARDPGAIADALAGLAGAPDRRRALGRAARVRVDRTFSLDRMVDRYRHIYLGNRPISRGDA